MLVIRFLLDLNFFFADYTTRVICVFVGVFLCTRVIDVTLEIGLLLVQHQLLGMVAFHLKYCLKANHSKNAEFLHCWLLSMQR